MSFYSRTHAHRYFGDRIVSRCDVANIRADGNDKSLERIFPGYIN